MDTKQSYPTIKDFVLQQAHQKSFEVMVLGLKDYQKEKGKIFDQKKNVLHQQFDHRTKQKIAAQRIHKSALINNSRMLKMQSRNKFLQEIVLQAQKNLALKIVKNSTKYRQFLKGLIMQGLIKLFEPVVYVRCLKRDAPIVSDLIGQCKKQFKALINKEGIDQNIGNVDLKLDDRYFLQERQITSSSHAQRVGKSQQSERCFGGVILTDQTGVIACKNTLDTRIELAYQHLLPSIRKELFY